MEALKLDQVIVREAKPSDYPEMVRLFTSRYRECIQMNPLLPHRYLDIHTNEQMIHWLFDNYMGVVAYQKDRLIGYIGGIIVPHFKGTNTGIYTPEWGHCIDSNVPSSIYFSMLERMDEEWRTIPYYRHAISFLMNEQESIKRFFWAGYGMSMIDGLAEANGNLTTSGKFSFRPANVYDWDALTELILSYGDAVRQYPTYVNVDVERMIEELESDLVDPSTQLWVAEQNKRIYGLIKTMEDCKESCTIVRDRKTLGIGLLVIIPSMRQKGIGTDLLKHVIRWAKEHRFERVTYALDTANIPGRTLFLKYFQPVCYTVIRYFDDRVIEKAEFKH